jgi:hypothetical protein
MGGKGDYVAGSASMRGFVYYRAVMQEKSHALSAVSLRLGGEVSRRALDRVAADGSAAVADLDQHVSAVREAIAGYPVAGRDQEAAVASRAALDARVGAAGMPGVGELLSAIARRCPDAPFVASVLPEEVPPLTLLLHYLCGFVEEAVTRDWWPAAEPDAELDWESLRIAATCQLISRAEAAGGSGPGLP